MNVRNASAPMYPPVVPRVSNFSSNARIEGFERFEGVVGFDGLGFAGAATDAGASPRPKAIRSRTSRCAGCVAVPAGTIFSVQVAVAVVGAKHVVSLHA